MLPCAASRLQNHRGESLTMRLVEYPQRLQSSE
jgi:hypothetical protein